MTIGSEKRAVFAQTLDEDGTKKSLSAALPPVVVSDDLFRGKNEILIAHGDAHYRLRITRQGKLILNK